MIFKTSLNMKKKATVFLAIILNINYFCYSQAQEGMSKKVDSLQVEYFTKELTLTANESQQFWPVYKNYKNDIKDVRKESENDPIALEEKILNIRKKYRDDFKKILDSDDRVNKVFVLEKSFRDLLRNELLDRQSKGDGSKDPDN